MFLYVSHSQCCYAGYPKRDFPTKSMQARSTALPDKEKTFTLQRDNGQVYVFTSAEDHHGPSRTQLVSEACRNDLTQKVS